MPRPAPCISCPVTEDSMAPAHPHPSQPPVSAPPAQRRADRRTRPARRVRSTLFRTTLSRTTLSALTVAAVVGTTSLATAAGPATASANYPVVYSFAAGITAELFTPGASPPGSNDFGCKPTATHPYPVVLVHGTFGDMTDSWQALSPL